MITAIIFDLDQTLLNRTATFQRFLEKQHARFEARLESVSQADFVSAVIRYDNNGYAPKQEVYAQVCRDWNLSIENYLLDDFHEKYGWEPVLNEGALDVLEILSKRYRLGLISNGRTIGQNAKIDQAGLRKFFKSIKISETEGIKKPHPDIFKRCLDEVGVTANQAVYIGDHPEKDVAAAQKVGLKGIWMANQHYAEPEFADGVIHNLHELIDLLA